MPFPIVRGVPNGFPTYKLAVLRDEIVAYLAKEMKIKPGIVTPFFLPGLLDRPSKEVEHIQGGSTIFVSLATGMFQQTGLMSGEKDSKAINSILQGLGEIVADAFHFRYEVEVFLDNLDPGTKAFIPSEEPVNIIDVAIPRPDTES
ncbi:MAG: hypothetical protein WEC39_01290 [Patescibacteria group bacterium]